MGTARRCSMSRVVSSRLLRGLNAATCQRFAHIACVSRRSPQVFIAAQRRPLASLPQVLEQEVEDETSGFQETLDNLTDLRAQAGGRSMELTESKGCVELRFASETDTSGTVTVKFHCQDSSSDANDNTQIKFAATFESSSHGRDMIFECMAADSKIEIVNAAVFDGDDYDDVDAFTTPIFDDLSDELRGAFIDFLAENHVDGALGSWLVNFAHFKELELYADWLQKVRGIV